MKTKLIYAIAFTFLVQIANAQMIGVKGGVNVANMSMSMAGMSYSPDALVGFHLGPVIDFKLQKNLYLNTGLLYSLKGYNLRNVENTQLGNASHLNGRAKLSYFDIPLNLAYKIPFSNKFKFFVQGGPYAALGLGGSVKNPQKVSGGGLNTSVPIQDIYSHGTLAKADYGVGAGAGFEVGPMVFSVNYDYGLRNLNFKPYTLDIPGTLKITTLEFSITYMFGNLASNVGTK